MGLLTAKQRDTLLKITLNASNGVLGGLILGNILGQYFRTAIFIVGICAYIVLVIFALLLER